MTSQKTLHILKGDDLILQCNLQDQLPKADISWNSFKPLPKRTIITRTQLVIKSVSENLGHISCYASLGLVSWEQRFEIILSSTPENQENQHNDTIPGSIPSNIEAYSCLDGHTSPVATISLAQIQECRKESFSRFKLTETDSKYLILHQQRVTEVSVKRCFLRVEISRSFCTSQGPMAFIPTYKGSIKVAPTQCETAHIRGYMNISLGHASMYMSRLVVGDIRHTQTYLHGSGVDGNNKCTAVTGAVYNGPNDPTSPNYDVNQVVLAEAYLSLDEEEGLRDNMKKQILVPRLGIKMAFINQVKRVHDVSFEHGTIYAKIEEKTNSTCNQFELVASNTTGAKYEDKTPELDNNHQDVVVLNLEEYHKKIALYLGPEMLACNMRCASTQITNIFVCPQANLPEEMPTNDRVITELSSQAFLHLQINTDTAFSHQLYMSCRHRRGSLQLSFRDFSKLGLLAMDYQKGTVSLQRGESGTLFLCTLVPAEPIIDHKGCCEELPVNTSQLINGQKIYQTRYLQAITRILVDNCTPTQCSDDLPVKFDIQKNSSICQTSDGVIRCNTSKILNPAENLMSGVLTTLDKSQTQIGNSLMLTSTLRNLMVEIMTKYNFHRNLAGTISWNSQFCKGKYYCVGAHLAPTDVRRELYRQSETLLAWLTNQNEAFQLLHSIVTLWGGYSIFSGILFLMLRSRTFCSQKSVARFGCVATILSIFSEIDSALNPNGILRTNFKFKLQELTENLEHCNTTIEYLKKNQSEFIKEMKQQMDTLKEELRDKKLELSHYSQVLDDSKPASRFDKLSANLKLAQLTPKLARLLTHTDVSCSDTISPHTPLLTNETQVLDNTSAEAFALYQPRSEKAKIAVREMHLHSANLAVNNRPPTQFSTFSPTSWPTIVPPPATTPTPPPAPPTAPTPPPRN